MKNKIFLLTSILSLTGCTPAYDDLNEWMTKTRQDAKSHIIPFEAPVVNPPAVYNPPAYSGLNAFGDLFMDFLRNQRRVKPWSLLLRHRP